MHQIRATAPTDRSAVEALLDRSFGPDRHLRTAYRLREAASLCRALQRVAIGPDGMLLATIEFWHVQLAMAHGAQEALLLGPIAVEPARRGEGIGVALIEDGIARARALGHALIMLVGDLDYYARFGFSNAQTAGWRLPGPVEQERVLALPLHANMVLPKDADVLGLRLSAEQAA